MGLRRCLYFPIVSQSARVHGRTSRENVAPHAILNKNVQALFDGQRGIEDDQAEAQGEDIVTGADL